MEEFNNKVETLKAQIRAERREEEQRISAAALAAEAKDKENKQAAIRAACVEGGLPELADYPHSERRAPPIHERRWPVTEVVFHIPGHLPVVLSLQDNNTTGTVGMADWVPVGKDHLGQDRRWSVVQGRNRRWSASLAETLVAAEEGSRG